jgi:hypothetical protein
MIITGTFGVVLIVIAVAVYLLEFAGKAAKRRDRRTGRGNRYGHASPAQSTTGRPADEPSADA